jgi:hypothetical protein
MVISHEIDDRDPAPVFAMGSHERARDGKRLDFARSIGKRAGRARHEKDDEKNDK